MLITISTLHSVIIRPIYLINHSFVRMFQHVQQRRGLSIINCGCDEIKFQQGALSVHLKSYFNDVQSDKLEGKGRGSKVIASVRH